ncbi:MAG: NAD(P)-dependent oxidoreductase [Rhodococcus sp. (in: high G+C Gram-positive bacteria)]|nr:MAG: NAD(P)-dependent oxidoreductase [Rhodococcus sp. (in: high G+C Gram-positive bacteria)]
MAQHEVSAATRLAAGPDEKEWSKIKDDAPPDKGGIGYVGLGAMGGALARNLCATHSLVVHDRDYASAHALTDAGARPVGNLDQVAASCDIVFLCLPTSDQVTEVLVGPGGLADKLVPGSVVIDQTTGDPAVTRRLAGELADRGIVLVDAPVSGGVPRALDGTIAMMVGAGDDDFARISPLLASMTPNVFHAGDVGAGHAMKLVNNLMSGVQRLLTFECLALAAKSGIAPDRAHEILMAGGARNSFLEKVVGPSILGGAAAPDFSIKLSHKDVRLACQMASLEGVPVFLGVQAREILQMCMAVVGPDAEVDQAALVLERLSGTRIVSSPAIFKKPPVVNMTDATEHCPPATTPEDSQ